MTIKFKGSFKDACFEMYRLTNNLHFWKIGKQIEHKNSFDVFYYSHYETTNALRNRFFEALGDSIKNEGYKNYLLNYN